MHLSSNMARDKFVMVFDKGGTHVKRIHYGWFVCAGCALLLFCTSGLSVNAFTVYQPYILRQNDFTNAQSSAIITVRSLFSFLAMFFTGRYYKIFSLRTGIGISGILTVLGFALFGMASGHFVYCAAAALIGLGYGFGTMIPVAIVLEHWFAQKRTFAIGICSACTGLSTLGIPNALTWLIEKYGLRTAFFTEAACIAALLLIAVLLIRDFPENLHMQPYGFGQNSAEKTCGDAAPRKTLTTGHWVLIWAMLLLLGPMMNVGYSHLTVLVSTEGFNPQLTALSITVSGVALTVGKFLFGWMSDKIGTYKCNWIFGAVLVAGLILCCMIRANTAVLLLAMCCYGGGLATTSVGLTAWAGDLSAPEQYDTNVRRFQLGYAAGTLLFSSLPGTLADHFGGSYIPAYIFFVGCAVFVLLSVQWLYGHVRSVEA